jgi:hypothetical protein
MGIVKEKVCRSNAKLTAGKVAFFNRLKEAADSFYILCWHNFSFSASIACL